MTEFLPAPKQMRRRLKKLYAGVGRAPEGSGDANALSEHYYRLEDALSGAVAYERKHREMRFHRLWRACGTYISRTAQPGTESAAAFFGAENLSLAEAAALGVFLPAAWAAMAVSGYGTGATQRGAKALFALREIDFEALLPAVCKAERILSAEEAYRVSDADTKAWVREKVSALARRTGAPEEALCARLGNAPGGVFGALPPQSDAKKGAAALLAEAALALIICAAAVFCIRPATEGVLRTPAGCCLLAVLLYLPVLFAIRPGFQRVLEAVKKPYVLPALDPGAPGVSLPPVLITVATLLPEAGKAAEFAAHLKRLYGAAAGCPAAVLALTDLKNAPVPETPADAADIAAMRREIDRLNRETGGHFLLAVRGRVYSGTEKEYTGRERKRGAVEALVRLIKDGADGFDVLCGDLAFLKKAKYLLCLDADTELPFASLEALLRTAYHPANRAVWDAEKRRVTSGYGCFAPRTEVSRAAAAATRFARIFTRGGVSAYSPRVASRYMDLFGTGVFCGKGLIDIDIYRAVCCGAFPEGRILSHDILEGSLLRTAFVSSAVVSEGFPASPASYFRRQARWIRGDVQNTAFLRRPLARMQRLPALAKYQLLDNVCRALCPPACLAVLLCSVFLPFRAALPLFILSLLGAAAGALTEALGILIKEGPFGFSGVYFSAGLSAGAQALLRAVLAIAFLPYEAMVNADSVLRACFRMCSGRRTLEWTTAADAEKHGRPAFLYPVAFPAVCAAVLSFGYPFHILPAALMMLFAPFAVSNGRPNVKRPPRLTAGEADALRQYAAAIWRYFETYAGEADHFLPPDNVQETPVRRVAHRTSPTNIGLYLLCVLAVADLSLISPQALSERLTKSMETVRSLRRYKGLLYNWYDTKTLEPLSPAFVSSVDCGNYLICLTALSEGLKEYAPLGFRFSALIGEIETELREARIEALYAPRAKLFSVGLDLPAGRLSDSCYDCYMSEARMTSFYAVAKRLVPAAHWAVPDRSFLRRGRLMAAASYGGTMFEYFMPALFLPLYENSLAAEGLKSCLYEQKRRARGARPWGVSESGYYDFDEAVNYRYRAHGLRALALKRDPNDVPVYAPYASFLALPLDPHGALKNLRRFASLGAYGACGFYEAVDFSAGAMGEDYMIVRSFMAHHLGMSMVAAVNALRDGLFVRRFSRDALMNGALSLLEERIPSGAPVRRKQRFAEPKKRPPDPRAGRGTPAKSSGVFSNGEVTLITNEKGENYALYGRRSLFRFSSRAPGVSAAVFSGGKALRFSNGRLLPTGRYAITETPGLTAETALAPVDRYSALAVPVKLKNRSKTALTARTAYYFEPDLEPLFFASEHPAFSEMNLRIEFLPRHAALLIKRMERGACAACVAAGFHDFSSFAFACDREAFPGADPLAGFPAALPSNAAFAFPCVAVQTETRLGPGEKNEKILLLCPGADAQSALRSLSGLRRSRLPDLRRAVGTPVAPEAAPFAERFLQTVFFGAKDPDITQKAQGNTAPVSALWEKGISGDVPILRVRADGIPAGTLRAFVTLHRALLFSGVPADLVLFTEKPSAYRGEAAERLKAVLPENAQRVFVLSAEQCSPAFLSALAAAPGMDYPFSGAPLVPAQKEEPTLSSVPLVKGENTFVPGGYFIGEAPPRPWCHTLSNAVFGTMVCYGSLGFTWALNARLNQLTPWPNDPAAPAAGETLLLQTAEGTYDVLSGASVYFRDTQAEYGAVCGKTTLRVTVQADAVAMKKRISVRWEGGQDCKLTYRVRPLLCDSAKRAPYLRGRAQNGALTFANPANTDYPGVMRVFADVPCAAAAGAGEGALSATLEEPGGEISFYMVFAAKERALEALCALPFSSRETVKITLPLKVPALRQFGEALLLHGVYDTRIWARTAFYQNSGAYGFRDQLQDSANVCGRFPRLARTQLLRCASAQFPEGDALHWFHVIPGISPHYKGVRTRCADDFLWLPWAAAAYVDTTGDTDILSLPVPYLSGEALAPGETERCGDYYAGPKRESMYSHCLRAIRRALRFGEHAVPLMLGGDWNDAFGEAGVGGRGESVWLGMFLILVCDRFAPLCRARGDGENEALLRQLAADLRLTVRDAAFNGRYFIRGFYDSGEAFGAGENGPCKIDLLPQAFAVFAGVGTREERISALRAAYEALFDPAHQTLRLFYPPFDETTVRAGYVNDYPPGVRENAGQYTHAAVWFAMALRKEGLLAEAESLWPALVPALRQKDAALWARFRNEPYAVTADICMSPGAEGRGGWSGYTGAAGWIWRYLQSFEF